MVPLTFPPSHSPGVSVFFPPPPSIVFFFTVLLFRHGPIVLLFFLRSIPLMVPFPGASAGFLRHRDFSFIILWMMNPVGFSRKESSPPVLLPPSVTFFGGRPRGNFNENFLHLPGGEFQWSPSISFRLVRVCSCLSF